LAIKKQIGVDPVWIGPVVAEYETITVKVAIDYVIYSSKEKERKRRHN
jgi:hypothetical protein